MTQHSNRRTRLTPSLGDTALQPVIAPAPGQQVGFDDGPVRIIEFFDDFTGSANSAPDSSLWLVDTVNQGGVQTYSTSTSNVYVDGSSNLVLKAIRSGSPGSYTYTSGHITTRTKWNFGYGKIAASIKFPKGPGLNPAFWTLQQGSYGVPAAEIDMAEMFGAVGVSGGAVNNIALHDHGPSGGVNPTATATVSGVSDLTDDYHEYWVIRSSNRIQIGIDDVTYADWSPLDIPANWELFQRPLYLIMNLAVGGVTDFYGAPNDTTTPFPSMMLIDWVRYTPSIVSVPSRVITDSTRIGRSVLRAADAAAVRTAIGVGSTSKWFTGSGAPGTVAGSVVGDFYLDTASGQIYQLS